MKQKVFNILIQSDVLINGNKSFSLYSGDMIICEEHSQSINIVSLKFKFPATGFGKTPPEFQTLNLKQKFRRNLRCRTYSNRWLSIKECLENKIIEDFTIRHQRDNLINQLIET